MRMNKFLFSLVMIFITNSLLFGQISTFTGTGNWSNAALWDNGVPSVAVDAVIASGANCTVDVSADCNSLTFTTANASNSVLTISGANVLQVVTSVLYTNPAVNFNQTIDVGSGTLQCASLQMPNTGNDNSKTYLAISTGLVTVSGNVVMNGSQNRNYITFSSSGMLSVAGHLGTSNNGRLTASSATIEVGGNFNVNTFTANTSTMVFNGAAIQSIDNVSYYSVVLTGGGAKVLTGATTILTNGGITYNNGALVLSGYDLILGNAHTVGGTPGAASMIDFSQGGRLVKGGTAVAHWQIVYPIGTNSEYSPLEITGAAVDVNGTLNISLFANRHALLNGANNALNRYWELYSTDLLGTTFSGSLTYSDTDVQVPINETNLIKTACLTSAGWSQNPLGSSYNHTTNKIIFSATPAIGTWTLGENSGCFDGVLPNKYTVASGNWTTAAIWNGNTVPVDGNNVTILHTVTRTAGSSNVGNLIVETGKTLQLSNQNIIVTGTTLIKGTVTDNNTTGINTFGGRITIASGGTLQTAIELTAGEMNVQGGITNNGICSLGAVNFAGTATLEGVNQIQCIGTATFDGSAIITLQNPLLSTADIVLTSGSTLDCNGNTVSVAGNITIANGALLQVDSNAKILFTAASKCILNSGTLDVQGLSGNSAEITATNTSNRFYITNLAGSTCNLKYYKIDYLTGVGVQFNTTAVCDAIADNFSYGEFGYNCNPTQCLQITGVNFSTNNPISVQSTEFNASTGYNISRTSGTGVVNLANASGPRVGQSYEQDNGTPGTLINWTFPATTYYTVASGNFSNPAIWNADPSAHFTDATAVFQIMDGHIVVVDTDIDVLELRIGNGVSGGLTIGNSTTVRTIKVREKIEVQSGGILSANSAAIHVLNVYGSITNNGLINLRTTASNVVDMNVYGVNSLFDGTNTITCNSLNIKSNAQLTTATSIHVKRSIILENNSIFNDGGLNHTVEKDWTETGTAVRNGSGTITFSSVASVVSATDNSTVQLHNVVCSNFGSVTFGSTTQTNVFVLTGSLSINDTKEVLLLDDAVQIAGDVLVQSSAKMSGGSALVSINGSLNQTIDLSGNVSLYDITFSGNSTKSIIGNLIVTRYVTIQAGATLTGSGTHEFSNTFTCNGICNFSGTILQKGGNITSTNALLDFAQLSHLIVNGNVAITTASSLQVRLLGSFELLSNQLIINNNTSLVSTGAGVFTLTAGNLYIRDDDGFPTGFASYSIVPTTTVSYDAAMSQIVRGGVSYGILYMSSNGQLRTADGNIRAVHVNCNSTSITFNVAGYNMNISGNIQNAATATINMSAGGTLTLDAEDANQTMGASTYNLTHLTFSLASPSAHRTKSIAAGSTIVLSGNFITTCGSAGNFILNVSLANNSISGTAQNLLLGQYTQLSTTAVNFKTAFFDVFTGLKNITQASIHYENTTATQYIAHGVIYGNIILTGTQIKEASGNLTIQGAISVNLNTPYFKGGGYTHTIAGNWYLSSANTRVADLSAGDNIIFNGIDQVLYPSNFQNIVFSNTGVDSLSGPAGSLVVYGNLMINNASHFTARTRSIQIYGNWSQAPSSVFTQDAPGVVTFMSTTSNQTIASNSLSYFAHVTITKNTGATFQKVSLLTDVEIKNTLSLTADAAVFDMQGHMLTIGGDVIVRNNTFYAANPFITGAGTVVLNGTDIQQIYHYSSYALQFATIENTTSPNKMFRSNATDVTRKIIITGNFINNGQNIYGYQIGDATTYVNFEVLGNWVNYGNFYHLNTATVTFTGANQSIGSSDFWNVLFAGTGTKTIQGGGLTVKQDLTVLAGVTLDVDAIENNSIFVTRNFDISAIGAVFEARNGLVTCGGAGTIITGCVGENSNKNFYDLEIKANVGLTGDLDVDNNVTITTGTFTLGSNKLFIGGNFENVAGTFTHTNTAAAQVIFNATGGTKYINPGPGVAFRTVTIDAAITTEYIVLNNFSINNNYDITINSGIVTLQGKTLTVNDANTKIVINTNGVLNINDNSVVQFTNTNQSIRNFGGILKLVGSIGNIAVLTKTAGSYYVQQTAGTLHANYYKCEAIGAGVNGCISLSGGDLDAVNNFSNGIFILGNSTATTTAYIDVTGLQVSNATNLVISNVTFNGGGTTNKNIKRNTTPAAPNNGYIECQDCIGGLSGPINELDDAGASTGFVRWTYPLGFFWEGDNSDDWHDNQNWQGGLAPSDSTHFVYFDQAEYIGPYAVAKVKTNDAVCGRLIITDGGAGLGVSVDNGYDLSVYGALVASAGSVITVTSPLSEINSYGDWTNSGTFTHGNGTINFKAKSGNYSISQTIGNFYNFKIYSKSAAIYSLASNIAVNNNFDLVKGSLDVLTRDITVAGNWKVFIDSSATFIPKLRTVTFNGTNQTITNGTFYNVTTAGTSNKTISSNLDINGTVTIGAGTSLQGGVFEVSVAGNWINNGNFSQTGTGTIIFDGVNQQIDNTGLSTTRFNKVTFAGTGTKTFYKSSEIWGDVIINSGASVNFSTYTIDGGVAVNSLINNGYMYIDGANNFPTTFETIEMSNTSRVYYRYTGGDQIIKTNDASWSYGNLFLENLSATNYKKIPTAGNLTITGSLYISHTTVVLDMNQNSANMILTGGISLPTGGQQIVWGIGATKLTHVGGDWDIDADITGFNSIEFGGTTASWKRMHNNLTITGDVTVKAGIYLMMDPNNNALPKTMTCSQVGKTFTLETGARIYSSTPASTDVAMPKGFSTYNLHTNSFVYLRAPNGVNQTVYTDNGIRYGTLAFQNTKTVTSDGVAPLRVKATFNMGTCIYADAAQNIDVAGDILIYNYTPTAGVSLTCSGTAQTISNPNATAIILENVVFAGTNTKILGNGDDVVTITGNVIINSGVTVTSARNISFEGGVWNNNGIFTHTATFTITKATAQTIQSGAIDVNNYFTNLTCSGANAVEFTNHADINGVFTIASTAAVTLGAYTYSIAGNVVNTSGGVCNSSSAHVVFDGGNQTIQTPDIIAASITLQGIGTKRMFSNWTVLGNLTITGVTLNNYNTTALTYHQITVGGNWQNTGTFTHNDNSKVVFTANSNVSIANGTSTFWIVEIGDDAGVSNTYSLASPSTIIRKTLTVNEDAVFSLQGNYLEFGYNAVTPKVITVKGGFEIDANATLAFQNQSSVCHMNVANSGNPAKAYLKIVGSNSVNVATITRATTGGQVITVSNATIYARYYVIEYLANSGMDITPSATLDATDNFSNGTFSNINNAVGALYLNLEAAYSGGPITDVVFNANFTPVIAQQYNVRRELAASNIEFGGSISGALSGYSFEDDEFTGGPMPIVLDASRGKIQWPAITETQWTGLVNSDWNNAGNWSVGVPTSAIDAVIPNGVPNDPILNVNAECKKLRITSGILTLDGGFDITSYGDVTIGEATGLGKLIVVDPACTITCGGSWARGVNGQFIHGNSTVLFNSASGTVSIDPRNSSFGSIVFDNPATTFSLAFNSGSTISVVGNFEILQGTVTPITTNYILQVAGNFVQSGTFSTTTIGTLVLNGLGVQTITGASVYNLTVSGGGVKYTNNAVSILGTTIINSNLQANAASSIDFGGNVTIVSGATFNDGNQSHIFTGSVWTNSGTYTGSGTITFNRTTGGQSVAGSPMFNNIIIACAGQVFTVSNNMSVTGNVTVKTGVTRLDILDKLITNTASLGSFTVESGVMVYITGANHFPKQFTSYDLATTSTCDYRGGSAQIIGGGMSVAYGNIVLTNANIKTLSGDIVVLGTITLNTATLDVSSNNYSISLYGNWINTNVTGGVFVPRLGIVVFLGTANQTIQVSDNSTNPFHSIYVNKTTGTVSAPNNKNTSFTGDIYVENGTYTANGRTSVVGGNLYADNGLFGNSGTYQLTKSTGTAYIKTNFNTALNTGAINNLTITGAAEYIVQSNVAVYGDFNLTSGVFNGNGYTVALGNASTDGIQMQGTYKIGAGGILWTANGASVTVSSTGSIEVVGTGVNNAIVTTNPFYAGRYAFTVDGSIKAQYYQFHYMNASGINVTEFATIDAVDNFSNGIFTNGAGGGVYLQIQNSQSFVSPNYIANVSFPVNPGTSAKNVKKTKNSGVIEFYESSGVFSGALYEYDDYSRINWLGVITLTWNGSTGTDWNTAANWTPSFGPAIVPTGAENVVIPNVTNKPRLTGSGQFAKKITIQTGAKLTFDTDLNASATDLTVYGDFEILGTGTLELLSTNDFISVQGNWTLPNTATVINNGTVTFNGNGASKTIDNGNKTFYNLVIDSTSVYTIARNTTVLNNVNISTTSVLDAGGNRNITVGGNWGNLGTFIPQTGKVLFIASSGTKQITQPNSSFNNVDINATVVYMLQSNVRVNGTMNIVSGTCNQNQKTLYVGDGVGADYLNVNTLGVHEVGPSGTLLLANGANVSVSSGGTFRAVGSNDANKAVVSRQSTGTYGFVVDNLGVFGARYYTFEFMNVAGITLNAGAVLESANNLSNGTFANGASGGTYLTLLNQLPNHPSDEIIESVTFNAGPLYNVTRTSGTTIAMFTDASGTLGTYAYENDEVMPAHGNTGLIQWTLLNTAIWTGATNADWHTASNWSTGSVPVASSIVVIANTTPQPIITSSSAVAQKLTIQSGATLTVQNQNVTIGSDVWYAGTITAIGSPIISVGGEWVSVAGTFNPGNSKVMLGAASGTNAVSLAAGNFYDLEVNSGGIYKLEAPTLVSNSVSITQGVLQANGYDLYVGKDWNVAGGTFTPGTKTVYFNGSATSNITSGGSSFYAVSFTGTGTRNLQSSLQVSNRFSQSAGTLNVSPDAGATNYNVTIQERFNLTGGTVNAFGSTITVNENWNISGTGVFNAGTSTVVMSSNIGTKTITSNNQSFNNLKIQGTALYNINGALRTNGNLEILQGNLNTTTFNYPISVGGNWVNNASFTPNGSVVMFNGNGAQTISGTASNHSFCGLTIENTSSAGIILMVPVVVSCSLNLSDGTVYGTSVNTLTLLSSATSNEGSDDSFVDGPIIKYGNTAYIFPTGDNGYWAPIGMSAPAVATDAFVAQYFFARNSNQTPMCTNCDSNVVRISSIEYWDFSPVSGTSTPNVTMYFKDLTRSQITSLTDLAFAHWNGVEWERKGTNTGVSEGINSAYIIGTGFTSYSPMAPASLSGENLLPITLTSFTAFVTPHSVDFTWVTETEKNNDYFTLEYSIDGIHYTTITKIKGAGNSHTQTVYEYSCTDPQFGGLVYVRLKQTDYDGTVSYSEVLVLDMPYSGIDIFVYPNPATDYIVIQDNAHTVIGITFSDVTNQKIELPKTGEFTYSLSHLPQGVYTVTISTESRKIMKKIVKL